MNSAPYSQSSSDKQALNQNASSVASPSEEGISDEQHSPSEPQPSYVKLAMRNMVRKGGKSLFHFSLTVIGLLATLVGLAYLTR